MSSSREAFERLPERIQRCVRPSLCLRTTPTSLADLSMGQSRIGGQPDLSPGYQWPSYDGLPLSFIAQLDLAELAEFPPVLPLPSQGSLFFFYDSEQRTWGFDPKDRGSAVVVYFPESSSLVRDHIAAEEPEAGRFFPCCELNFALEQTLPDTDSIHYQPDLTNEERNLLNHYFDSVRMESKQPRHRLGGHADCVQHPMEVECQLVANGLYYRGPGRGYEDPKRNRLAKKAVDWRLLLQIDSDDNTGMMWGDCGRIYFWIREEDLRHRRFDKCWLILQCG